MIRFHESLLFLHAFPHSPGMAHAVEKMLRNFPARVDKLRAAGADMEEFDPLEVSGIAATSMEDPLSCERERGLGKRNEEGAWLR